MKRFVAMITVVSLVMSLIVMAQAEVHVTRFGDELMSDGTYAKYLVIESDTGESVKLHITEEEMDQHLTDLFETREAERRANNPTGWERFCDTITFWN